MKKIYCMALLGIGAAGLLLPSVSMAAAQYPATRVQYFDVAPQNNSTYNAVILGGTTIMRFRVAAGGYSPHQRAVATQERVNKLLGEGPIYASDITTQMSGADAIVLVKDQLLFTADAQTAAYNTSTPMDLANMWADRMRRILPELTAPH